MVISELLAINTAGLTDTVGRTRDWIELYNRSTVSVDLGGWYLTDSRLSPDEWQFPAGTIIAPGDLLLVFASGQAGAISAVAGELHANLKLSGDGEYLALVRPDGRTVASEYSPYPAQLPDVSFGRSMRVSKVALVGPATPASVHVPEDGSLGTRWTEPSFVEGQHGERWLAAAPAVGFDLRGHAPDPSLLRGLQLHLRLDAKATVASREVANAQTDAASDERDTIVTVDSSDAPRHDGQVVGSVAVVPGIIDAALELPGRGYGHLDIGHVLDPDMSSFTVSLWFRPSGTEGEQVLIGKGNDYAQYTGWRIFLRGDRVGFRGLQTAACPTIWCAQLKRFGQMSSPGSVIAGEWHHVTMVIDRDSHTARGFLNGSNAGWVSSAADIDTDSLLPENPLISDNQLLVGMGAGRQNQFAGLIDDVAMWGRALTAREVAEIETAGRAGQSLPRPPRQRLHSAIVADIDAAMWANSPSAYVRVPFWLPRDVARLDAVKLAVTYDAGFVAYINGVEVARRHAPARLDHRSVAEGSRSDAAVLVPEVVNVTDPAAAALVPGSNLLALHGLNEQVTDPSFLLAAELWLERTDLGVEGVYLSTPTPGQPNGQGAAGIAPAVTMTRPHGLYEKPFAVSLSTEHPEATIRYSTDGSEPGPDSPRYDEPVPVNATLCLRARAFLPGHLPGPTTTRSFIFPRQVLQQPDEPHGFPDRWAPSVNSQMYATDYGMDTRIVSHPVYGPQLLDALRALPTVSLVADVDDLFGQTRGIYANPRRSGVAWERPVSMELIYPDGRAGLQVNAGVRIHGGFSRGHEVKKHSLRLKFKKRYGPGRLVFPLFGGDAVTQHDTLVLRAGYNNTWHTLQALRSQYITDEWVRRTHLAMGHPAAHGMFVHLYLNGLYWGVYNLVERPDRAFAAAYLGGDEQDWDALNAGYPSGDSRAQSWMRAQELAAAGSEDGQSYAALADTVDAVNLADYFLLNLYADNHDWDHHNWYAARRHRPSGRFKFFCWDSEHALESLDGDRSGVSNFNSPSFLFQSLRHNPVFLALFAERTHKHLSDGGALSPSRAAERYRRLADLLELPLVAESARWGDASHLGLFTLHNQWIPERDRVLKDFLPHRVAVFIEILQKAGLLQADASGIDGERKARIVSRVSSLRTRQFRMSTHNTSPTPCPAPMLRCCELTHLLSCGRAPAGHRASSSSETRSRKGAPN